MTPPALLISSSAIRRPSCGVSAERAEKAGQRRQVADLDLVLRTQDRRKSERRSAGKSGAGFQDASAVAGHHWSPSRGLRCRFVLMRHCERRFSIVGRYSGTHASAVNAKRSRIGKTSGQLRHGAEFGREAFGRGLHDLRARLQRLNGQSAIPGRKCRARRSSRRVKSFTATATQRTSD